MFLPHLAVIIGVILTLLGVGSYFMSEARSFTALIPSIIGILFLITGLLSYRQALQKHAMHAAAVVALLAIGGTYSGLQGLPALLSGAEVERPLAIIAKSVTAILSFAFIIFAIRFFVLARILKRDNVKV